MKVSERTFLYVILASSWLVLAWVGLASLANEKLISGESSILSNVVIDFVKLGKWHYPVHAQDLFYPAVEKFMIHPPMHYLLSSVWVMLFEIGPWQLHLQSFVSLIFGLLIGSVIILRVYGLIAAIFVPVFAISGSVFIFNTLELRPDMTFGLFHCLSLGCLGMILFNSNRTIIQIFSFLFGIFVASAIGAHWFGFFTQLYLFVCAIILAIRFGADSISPIAAVFFGWLSVMTIWFGYFGEDFFKSFIFVLLKGNDFRTSISVPLSNTFAFFNLWPGGHILMAATGASFLGGVFSLLNWLATKNINIKSAIVLFIWSNLVAYFGFYYIFVGNKHPQYSANVILLVYFLSSIALSTFITSASQIIGFRQSKLVFTGLTVGIMISLSPLTERYLVESPIAFKKASNHYQNVRRAFSELLPNDGTVLLGAQAYPYLYDKKYKSSIKILADLTLEDPGYLSFSDAISFYRKMKRSQYADTPISRESIIRALSDIDHIVICDSGSAWQWLFYEHAVWKANFKEVADVVIENKITNKGNYFPGFEGTLCNRYRVLTKTDREIPAFLTGTPKIIRYEHEIFIITPGENNRQSFLSGGQWNSLADEQRRSTILRYMNSMEWYGLELSKSEMTKVMEELLPFVNQYIATFNGLAYRKRPMERTLSDGIDFAMSKTNFATFINN